MMTSYKLSKSVRGDLKRIYKYGYENYGEAQADKYFKELFERFEKIAREPFLYQSVDNIRKGYRRSVCGVDSIYYRINSEGVVEIMSIISKQDIKNWLH